MTCVLPQIPDKTRRMWNRMDARSYFEADSGGAVKDYQFSEGDGVRVKGGPFASFRGTVVSVDNVNARLTVWGRFEGEQDSDRHAVNVSFSVAEKI